MRQAVKVYTGSDARPNMANVWIPGERLAKLQPEIVEKYIDRSVVELIEKKEDQYGKLSTEYKRQLVASVGNLWARSEQRKQEVLQELKEVRKQYVGIPMGVWHKDKNTVIRPNPVKAQEMMRLLAEIDRLVTAAFTPKVRKYPLYQIVKQQLQTV